MEQIESKAVFHPLMTSSLRDLSRDTFTNLLIYCIIDAHQCSSGHFPLRPPPLILPARPSHEPLTCQWNIPLLYAGLQTGDSSCCPLSFPIYPGVLSFIRSHYLPSGSYNCFPGNQWTFHMQMINTWFEFLSGIFLQHMQDNTCRRRDSNLSLSLPQNMWMHEYIFLELQQNCVILELEYPRFISCY